MPGPTPPPVDLTPAEQQGVDALVRRHSAPQQVATRARIILLAAEGLNNSQIARHLGLEVNTVRLWRQRWLAFQEVALADLSIEERLTDAPRLPRAPAGQPTLPLSRSARSWRWPVKRPAPPVAPSASGVTGRSPMRSSGAASC